MYAVTAIRSSDDIKTVQGNLGHATASFTLDKYGHVTDQMKRASADRMQKYIDSMADLRDSAKGVDLYTKGEENHSNTVGLDL